MQVRKNLLSQIPTAVPEVFEVSLSVTGHQVIAVVDFINEHGIQEVQTLTMELQ